MAVGSCFRLSVVVGDFWGACGWLWVVVDGCWPLWMVVDVCG